MQNLARNAAGHVGEQERPRLANLAGRDIPLHGRDAFVKLDHRAGIAHAAHRDRIHRAGAEGVHPHAARPQVVGHVAHHAVEGSLADAHHVVAGDHALAAVVGQRENGRTI